jgi:hypothetical protein
VKRFGLFKFYSPDSEISKVCLRQLPVTDIFMIMLLRFWIYGKSQNFQC